MQLTESILIKRPCEQVWSAITDISNCKAMISGILDIEVLDKPEDSLVGLKWKETREMFGKASTETMWITEAETHRYYQTRAESHGAVYLSGFTLAPESEGTLLTMTFEGQPQTLMAKVMSALMTGLIRKSMVKVVRQDLEDIKNFVEGQ